MQIFKEVEQKHFEISWHNDLKKEAKIKKLRKSPETKSIDP